MGGLQTVAAQKVDRQRLVGLIAGYAEVNYYLPNFHFLFSCHVLRPRPGVYGGRSLPARSPRTSPPGPCDE